MKLDRSALAALLALSACISCAGDDPARPSVEAEEAATQTQPAQLLLRNATIVDGSGEPSFVGDVGIADGRIVAVGPAGSVNVADGATVDDLDGLVLAPGFIDIHNHSDRAIAGIAGSDDSDPAAAARRAQAESLLAQGLTTIVVGADGSSQWPLGDYLDQVSAAQPAVNVAVTVGHGTVRRRILGDDFRREATASEVEAMAELVRQGMEDGAFGLSTGLEYEPGRYATTEELIALAAIAAEYNGFYISHMRDEELYVMEAVDEVIRIGFEAGLPVQISHIKMGDATAWGRSEEALERMRDARDRGLDITADWYPYTASATSLSLVVPSRRFNDPDEVAAGLEVRGGANRVQITRYAADPDIEGLRLDAIAARYGKTPVETYMQLMDNGGASMISHSMKIDDVNAFARDPLVMVCSDGGIGFSHPRGAGTFARVLAYYVRDEGILSLEDAVHKMTAMPARRLGLDDRGRIQVGAIADLVAFAPETIQDNSTFEEPGLLATGIERVWVAGTLAWNEGAATGNRVGEALRHR